MKCVIAIAVVSILVPSIYAVKCLKCIDLSGLDMPFSPSAKDGTPYIKLPPFPGEGDWPEWLVDLENCEKDLKGPLNDCNIKDAVGCYKADISVNDLGTVSVRGCVNSTTASWCDSEFGKSSRSTLDLSVECNVCKDVDGCNSATTFVAGTFLVFASIMAKLLF